MYDTKFTWEPLIHADGSLTVLIVTGDFTVDYTYDGELRVDLDDGTSGWYRKIW
jgi:hypothetical protein